MRGLEGKSLVVAGAATGIGAATAIRLAEEGARVVVGDLDADGAEKTAGVTREHGGEAIAVGFDIADPESVEALIGQAVAAYGGLDGVHVNAGAMNLVSRDTDVVDMDLEVWDGTVAVNLRGHMLVTRYAVPHLLERGGGALVYTSSLQSFTVQPDRAAYGATKAAINSLARHVTARWGRQGVRGNAVAPGLILTDAIRSGAPEGLLEAALSRSRSDRHGEVGDVAAAVAFLLSDDGSWITGQTLNVDGGAVMR